MAKPNLPSSSSLWGHRGLAAAGSARSRRRSQSQIHRHCASPLPPRGIRHRHASSLTSKPPQPSSSSSPLSSSDQPPSRLLPTARRPPPPPNKWLPGKHALLFLRSLNHRINQKSAQNTTNFQANSIWQLSIEGLNNCVLWSFNVTGNKCHICKLRNKSFHAFTMVSTGRIGHLKKR
uniref:Uncharacterized protein n=1 Tax=Oryza sativa subsp. japonica TaxID=39947 RepID=Q67UM7_ORYSJ|nr:hypothetical protein [Oryza sativa Japonica Group]